MVFTDECYVDKRNTLRKYGWSPAGERATIELPFLQGKRYIYLVIMSAIQSAEIREGLLFSLLSHLMESNTAKLLKVPVTLRSSISFWKNYWLK